MLKLDYTLIDYKKWDFGGRGKNICENLNLIERQIWERALAFQDKRKDVGHAEVATYMALQLLKYSPNNKREIVIPSIILHDIGYDIEPEEFRKAFVSKPDKEMQIKIRMEHQIKGCVLAYKILEEVKFPKEFLGEILRINVDHDTRFYESTLNGKIVWDADILWRVTKPCIDAYLSDKSTKEIRKLLEDKDVFPLLHLPISREVAKMELENSMRYYP